MTRRDLLAYLPGATLLLFLTPVAAGLIGTWLPAFGYFPTLGGNSFTLEPWVMLFEHPGLRESLRLTLVSGLLATVISFFPDRVLSRRLPWLPDHPGDPRPDGAAAGRAACGHGAGPRLSHRAQRLAGAAGVALGHRLGPAARRGHGAGSQRPGPDPGAGDEGTAVPAADDPGGAGTQPRRGTPGDRPLAGLRAGHGLAEDRAAGDLPPDPPARLCRARLFAFGGGHGADPGAAVAAAPGGAGVPLVQRPRPDHALRRRGGCGAAVAGGGRRDRALAPCGSAGRPPGPPVDRRRAARRQGPGSACRNIIPGAASGGHGGRRPAGHGAVVGDPPLALSRRAAHGAQHRYLGAPGATTCCGPPAPR